MANSTLHGARRFRFQELEIWQQAVDLIKLVYKLTKTFPKEEMFGLISQLRRAIISISSNIAEGSGGRTNADFKRYLDISIGSALESVSLLLVACELGFCSKYQINGIIEKLEVQIRRTYAFKKTL